ncbi:MAG: tyrosine-type recombinase/integrase [Spirochaetaceae bacterium]|nr:tyrosine-type recombinase/integrase [Spirochaetaceae bacterium]
MRDQLSAFATHLAVDNEPRTVTTYGAVMASFGNFVGGPAPLDAAPRRIQVEAFLTRRRRDGAPRATSTRNQELAALRAFAAFARRDLSWESDPTEGVRFAKRVRRDPAVLSKSEIHELFLTADAETRPLYRVRNQAMLAAFIQTGLRVHELVGLDVDQVDLAGATLLRLKGKGGSIRELPLNAPALALLRAWIDERPKHAEDGERALFVSARRTRISIRTVERIVQALRETMGSPKKITPHTLRHSFTTQGIEAGAPLSSVSEMLGHASIATTQWYIHLSDTHRREAVRRIEGTVPTSVLPSRLIEETTNATRSETPEAPASPPRPGLDDECGLVAAAA